MRIYCYTCNDPPLASQTHMARIWTEVPKGRQWVMGWLPISFPGETADEARAKAQAHWDEQIEAQRRKSENIQAAAAKRRKVAPQVIEEPI